MNFVGFYDFLPLLNRIQLIVFSLLSFSPVSSYRFALCFAVAKLISSSPMFLKKIVKRTYFRAIIVKRTKLTGIFFDRVVIAGI